ncbi:cyclic pyranopterin phosphate synthase [Anaerosphaera aminiphila DSM 21120]|uniref:Cyclic pyranopterin monophosphate synthase n=1 Tax=Anaerosphaera aminiphila DSM 21120 TaxID=1120995 RepID=A0A1M5UF22_9FIRM|nr:cyclic pyranopterin monophosphate synthase MoaC [Anaerosphaera aminiphila]SHH61511.1 cyclic pyranopterin phosphate synthase [Anaerosphaera aminiphila DSM 21120]
MSDLTHFDSDGNAVMVDVSKKDITSRRAIASGKIYLSSEAYKSVVNREIKKGDVLTVAQVGGIMGAKKTSELIPMAHPIFIENLNIKFNLNDEEHSIEAVCEAGITSKTGIEMEAMTGVSVCLLTIYDMVKAIDRAMVISDIKLLYKSGGKSGEYTAD